MLGCVVDKERSCGWLRYLGPAIMKQLSYVALPFIIYNSVDSSRSFISKIHI